MGTLMVLVCLMACIIPKVSALEIIPPYPRNEIALEGESLTISCTARDSPGYPSKVIFTRRSEDFFTYKEIPNSERVYVTNTTHNDTNGLTRTAVLHIKYVKPSDHHRDAPYQCWAYPAIPGTADVEKLVFTLFAIPKKDLPRAKVTGANTTLGGAANLTCQVTSPGNQYTAPLESLAWTKNTKIIKNGSSTTVDPLLFTAAVSKDGGIYKCVGLVKLQASKPISISLGTAMLLIRVQFVEASTEVVGTRGGSVVMECPAEGYPLPNIKWLKTLPNGQQVDIKNAINISMAERYIITRPCSYCRYKLTIKNFQSYDAGRYVCKAAAAGQHHFDLILSDTTGPTTGSPGTVVGIQSVLVGVLVVISMLIF